GGHAARPDVPRGALRPALRRPGRGASDGRRAPAALQRPVRLAVGLAEDLSQRLGGEVGDLERMLGGASRETWSLTLDARPLVYRRDPPGAPRAGAMRREAALLRAAAAAGVPVSEVV